MNPPQSFRDFGKLVASKRLPRANGVIVGLAASGFAYLAISVGEVNGTVIGVILFSLLLLLICAWSWTYRATLYENGAVVQSIFGAKSLGFRNLRTFGYSRLSMRGQPQDTLTLVPRTGKSLRIVVQPDVRSNGDVDISALVEVLSARFSEQIEKELTRTSRVAWVEGRSAAMPAQPAVALSRDAFLVASGKDELKIPFTDVDGSIQNGFYHGRKSGTRKVLFTIACSAVGFYPGLALQQRLQASRPVPEAKLA
ncbi:MAG: hypothetical protein ABJD11_06855 [Gemmatimonadota bacterium]